MESANVQVAFFQHIKSRLAPHLSLVDEIAEILNISTDSAYRRIRAEKAISFEELQKLCTHFKISLDHFLHLQSNSFIFSGNLANATDFNFSKYLADLLRQFQFMNTFSHKHMYSLLKDVGLHHFQLPELAAFRAFFWQKSILHYDEYKGKKFSVKDLNPEYTELSSKIVDAFCKIPTTEIWNIETINSTLTQFRFYKEAQSFAGKEDVAILFEKLKQLIDHLEKQAELGVSFRIGEKPRPDAAPFIMLNNELILGDNTFCCELDNVRVTYITHSVINFMMTRDEKYNDYMFESLQNLIRKSAQMSSVGEKERARFFNRLREKLHQAASH